MEIPLWVSACLLGAAALVLFLASPGAGAREGYRHAVVDVEAEDEEHVSTVMQTVASCWATNLGGATQDEGPSDRARCDGPLVDGVCVITAWNSEFGPQLEPVHSTAHHCSVEPEVATAETWTLSFEADVTTVAEVLFGKPTVLQMFGRKGDGSTVSWDLTGMELTEAAKGICAPGTGMHSYRVENGAEKSLVYCDDNLVAVRPPLGRIEPSDHESINFGGHYNALAEGYLSAVDMTVKNARIEVEAPPAGMEAVEGNLCDDPKLRSSVDGIPSKYKDMYIVDSSHRVLYSVTAGGYFYDANCDGAFRPKNGLAWPYSDCDCQDNPLKPNYCFCGLGGIENKDCAGPWHLNLFSVNPEEIESCR